MIIWIDAHLSPALAIWMNDTFEEVEAYSLTYLGLRDAEDLQIFMKARDEDVVVMTKDLDFIRLLDQHGPPPKVIWLTCGNTSNESLKKLLGTHLLQVIRLLENSPMVEIR